MKQKKYVTVDVDTESNIGVVDLGEVDTGGGGFKLSIDNEKKVVQALSEHFNYQVKVRSVEVKTAHPITVEVIVVVMAEEQDYQETVTLNETWVY